MLHAPAVTRRWTGQVWEETIVRRWDGTSWVDATVNIALAPGASWETDPILAQVDAGLPIAGVAVGAAFLVAYGISNALESQTGGGAIYSYQTEPFDSLSPNALRALRVIVTELAKYPPDIILGSGLSRITLVSELTNPDRPLVDFGGMTVGTHIVLDIAGFPADQGTYYDDGSDGLKLALHHELGHVIKNAWSHEVSLLESEWVSHNHEPYLGDAYFDLDQSAKNERPLGHTRMYGRYNFSEDFADVFGFLMTTTLQPALAAAVAEDPALSAKITIMKRWVSTKSPLMGHPLYFRAIHSQW